MICLYYVTNTKLVMYKTCYVLAEGSHCWCFIFYCARVLFMLLSAHLIDHGNLYVTDIDKSMIRVFSNDGVLLCSFGCDSNGVNRPNDPQGVCVSGQYVYVSNYDGHNVSLFINSSRFSR